MPESEITDAQWNAIFDSIDSESCILFLGAGVNVSRKEENYPEYNGLPLASHVALRLASTLIDETKLSEEKLKTLTKEAAEDLKLRLAQALADRKEQPMTQIEIEEQLRKSGPLRHLLTTTLPDLARVALEVQMESGPKLLWQRLLKILPDKSVEPSPMLEALASLKKTSMNNDDVAVSSPFKLIVTTNYDGLLERAFKNSGLGWLPVIQSASGVEIGNEIDPQSGQEIENEKDPQKRLSKTQKTIIYKIHGTFGENADPLQPRRLILTEEDYIEFLAVLGDQEKGVPPLISSKMRLASTILFLGYGLQDWDFRTIYKSMIESIEPNLRPESFAIQRDAPDYLVKYWTRKHVNILNVEHIYNFAEEFKQRWEKRSSTPRNTP